MCQYKIKVELKEIHLLYQFILHYLSLLAHYNVFMVTFLPYIKENHILLHLYHEYENLN